MLFSPFNFKFPILRIWGWFSLECFQVPPSPGDRQLCVLRQGPSPLLWVHLSVLVWFLACPSLFEPPVPPHPPCLSLCVYAHFFISSSASRQPPKKIWDYTPGDCSILPREDRKVIPSLLRGLCARPLALGAVSVLWLLCSFLKSFFFFF